MGAPLDGFARSDEGPPSAPPVARSKLITASGGLVIVDPGRLALLGPMMTAAQFSVCSRGR
jgi:hypothetical protein